MYAVTKLLLRHKYIIAVRMCFFIPSLKRSEVYIYYMSPTLPTTGEGMVNNSRIWIVIH